MVDVSLRLDNNASVQDADGQYSQASTHENTFASLCWFIVAAARFGAA